MERPTKIGYVKSGLGLGGASIADITLLASLTRMGYETEALVGYVDVSMQALLEARKISYSVDHSLDRYNITSPLKGAKNILGKLAACDVMVFSQAFCEREKGVGEVALLVSRKMPSVFRQHNYIAQDDVYSQVMSGVGLPVTQPMADAHHAKNSRIRQIVTPPYIDNRRFRYSENEEHDIRRVVRDNLGIEDSDTVILQPTRLHPGKGIDYSLALAQILEQETGNPTYLLIAGGNEQLSDSMECQRSLSARLQETERARCIFLNRTQEGMRYRRMADYMLAADLIAAPSMQETFGMTIAEAALCRKPVITKPYLDGCAAAVQATTYGTFDLILEERLAIVPTDRVLQRTIDILGSTSTRTSMVEHNFPLAQQYTLEFLENTPELVNSWWRACNL